MSDAKQLFHQARARSGTPVSANGGIKTQVVDLYRKMKALRAAGQDGIEGASQEYVVACCDLNRLLGRRPWMCPIEMADDVAKPPNPQWDAAGARALRDQLEAALS